MTVVTKAELARRFGVDRAQPTRWTAQGMPVLADGNVELGAAAAWVRSNIDPGARAAHQAASRGHNLGKLDPEQQSRLDAADAMVRLAVKFTADSVPTMIARLALEVGLSEKTARALHEASRSRMAAEVATVLNMVDTAPNDTGPMVAARGMTEAEWVALLAPGGDGRRRAR